MLPARSLRPGLPARPDHTCWWNRYAGLLLAVLLLGYGVAPAHGQPAGYTFALRDVPLDEALEAFSRTTGAAVAYDPHLVRTHRAFCVADDASPETALRCILKASGLDYYRLSSGTYVLTAPPEMAPEPGYLTGRIADRETGAPIPDAHVHLADADLGTVTDQSGRFTFRPLLPGRYVLRISHVGYRVWEDTVHVSADEATRTVAALHAEPIPVTPVVIDGIQRRRTSETLGRTGTDADRPPVGLSASTQGMFQRLGALPGVRLNDMTADVYVQGGDAGDHQIRLDGVPVHLPRTTLGLIGPFSSFAVDRITVDKAGFDATRGSQMGGIVRARHALASENRVDVQLDPLSLNGRLQVAPSIAGTEDVAAMAATRLGLWEVHAPHGLRRTLARWSMLDPFLLNSPSHGTPRRTPLRMDDVISQPSAHFSDIHAATRIRLSPLRTLHASVYRGARKLTGNAWDDPEAVQLDSNHDIPVAVHDDYRWDNLVGQIQYDALWGPRTLLQVQLRGSRYRLNHRYMVVDSLSVQPYADFTQIVGSTLTPLQDDNTMRSTALEGSLDHVWRAHQIQAGLAVQHTTSAFTLHNIYPATSDAYGFGESGRTAQVTMASPSASIRHTTGHWRVTTFASDEVRLSEQFAATLGTRLTYLPHRATVYAEPRLSLRYDRPHGPLGPWSMRTAAGVYRTFTHQADLSVFNAGALLPSVRVWLPVDASVTIPRAYHFTHEMLVEPTTRWQLRLESYLKIAPHRLAMRYAPVGAASPGRQFERQRDFLTTARGHAYGGSLSAHWTSDRWHLRALYEHSRSVLRSPALFNGRSHPTSWSRPHHLELGVDWQPTDRLTVSVRGHGIWNRPWGFRRIYYDYFGHDDATRWQPPYDLGRPGDHRLPPQYQLDVSLAYTHRLGPAALQARLEVLNVTDRANVADWRLERDGDAWTKVPRRLYPRLPSAALRLQF